MASRRIILELGLGFMRLNRMDKARGVDLFVGCE